MGTAGVGGGVRSMLDQKIQTATGCHHVASCAQLYLPGRRYFGCRQAYRLTYTKPGTTLFELALCPIGNVMGVPIQVL